MEEVKVRLFIWIIVLSLISFSTSIYAATGIIEVYSEPSGAKVYINNMYVGETPYQNVEIPIGRHRLKIFLGNDYPAQYWDVDINEITPQTKTFYFIKGQGGSFTGKEMEQTIEKHKGNVQFASIPTGAEIYINGKLQRKKTPAGYKDADVGRYDVMFKSNGKILKGHFEIIKNESMKIIADFNNMMIINKWEEVTCPQSLCQLLC